jgi:hypothetical protein
MPQIKLSQPTYQRLLKHVISFDDQPEDVIKRLLEEAGAPNADDVPRDVKGGGRAAPGSVLPVEEYRIPILQILEEAGGAAPSNDVVNALEERMADVLTQRDREPLQSGETRWRNRARFARLRMKEQGLLSDASRRGVWQMTQLGRQYLDLKESETS